MENFTDTHCHLYLPEFDSDRLDLINNLVQQGLNKILVPAIDLDSSIQVIGLCKKFPGFLFPALGIHPNHSHQYKDSELDQINKYAANGSAIAIGEIGLDFFRNWSPRDIQIRIFSKMLDLAMIFNLPICIHNRKAEDVLISMLDDWREKLIMNGSRLLDNPGVFHAFDGSPLIAEYAVKHKFKLGICGNITYKNSDQIHEIIRSIDLSHFLLETDSPYLTPEPNRGQRNDPRNLIIIARKLAEITGSKLNEIIKITTNNAAQLFRW